MPNRITAEMAAQIKERLYLGYTFAAIAVDMGVSGGTVYQIRTGMRYPEVPWPDGSTGPMSSHRISQLLEERQNKPGRKMNVNSRDQLLASAEVRERTDPVFAEAIRIGTEALENADKPDPGRESVISRYRRKRQGPPTGDEKDG